MTRKHYFTHSLLLVGICIFSFSCGEIEKKRAPLLLNEILAEDTAYQRAKDSLFYNPFWVRNYIAEEMHRETDSLRYYSLLSLYNKVYLLSGRLDTVEILCDRIMQYCTRNEKKSPYIGDLLVDTYFTLGNIEEKSGNNEQALHYFKKTLILDQRRMDKWALLNVQINVASTYSKLGKLPESIEYYRNASLLADSIQAPEEFLFIINSGLSNVYKQIGDYQKSLEFSDNAQLYLEEMHVIDRWMFYNDRGNLYYLQKKYTEALDWFLKAAKEISSYPEFEYQLQFCRVNLAEVYFLTGHSDSARYCLEESVPYFKSLGDENLLYHAATIQLGIALQEKRLVEARAILAQSPEENNIIPAIVLIRKEYLQKYYEQTRDYEKANLIMNERLALSDSINSHTIQMRVAEIEMRHQQDTTLLRQAGFIRAQESDLKTLKQSILIVVLLSAILLLMVMFRLFYIQKKRQYEQMEQTHRILELRMQSIRNRISPHFLFNALNRLLHTCREDEEKSQQIILLTRLMRHNLRLTDRLCISLREELEFIRNYLALEQQTMPELTVEMNISPAIDPEQMIVPAMFIQIPVENAVKHGLRGWHGEKLVKISVDKQLEEYHIRIEDNGRGFTAPSGNESPYSTGTGMKVITQTLQILNHYNKKPIDMQVTSFREGDDEYPGCRVTYVIPVNYIFRPGKDLDNTFK